MSNMFQGARAWLQKLVLYSILRIYFVYSVKKNYTCRYWLQKLVSNHNVDIENYSVGYGYFFGL
jgi:hypothetical protein